MSSGYTPAELRAEELVGSAFRIVMARRPAWHPLYYQTIWSWVKHLPGEPAYTEADIEAIIELAGAETDLLTAAMELVDGWPFPRERPPAKNTVLFSQLLLRSRPAIRTTGDRRVCSSTTR